MEEMKMFNPEFRTGKDNKYYYDFMSIYADTHIVTTAQAAIIWMRMVVLK